MNRIRALELEFDEPLADIVTGMREQGCNWAVIAGALGVSNQTLITWRREFGFAPTNREKIIEKSRRQKNIIAARLGYRNFRALYADLRMTKKMLVRDIAAKMGVHENTLYKWIPENMKGYIYIATPARVASRKKNLAKAREVKRTKYGTLWTGNL